MATGIELNTNVLDAVTSSVAMTTETTVTLYVVALTGDEGNYRVGLEVSPDGTEWVATGAVLRGEGCATTVVSGEDVRAKVLVAEGTTSTVTVFIIAH